MRDIHKYKQRGDDKMDKAFIYFCSAGEESYFFDKYKRTLSVKPLDHCELVV